MVWVRPPKIEVMTIIFFSLFLSDKLDFCMKLKKFREGFDVFWNEVPTFQ